jgi:hypothetical protein
MTTSTAAQGPPADPHLSPDLEPTMADTNAHIDRRDRYDAAIREAEGWVLDDGQHMLDAVLAVADAEQAELRRERDLAIAHDRQPYPTAWAYEEACTALNRHRDLAEVRRLALSAALRLGTGAPWETIRDRAAELATPADQAALRSDLEDALKGAGVYDSKERMWHSLSPEWIEEILTEVLAVLPAPADRAAILRAEAEHLIRDLYPAVYDDAGQKTALGVNRAARELLDRADAAELRRMADASGPGGVAGETQQPETRARRMMRSRFPSRPGTATVASDMCPRCKGDNSEAWALCARCAEQQPATQAPGTSPCTCADAGDCFAPAGHYADCPHHAPPAAVSQPDGEA